MAKQTTGEFLALLRRANGYTQQEVAERLNISNRTLSSWETDRTAPDILLLPAIADLYGVTVDELLRGERGNIPNSDISDGAKRAASKNRFGRFSAKASLLTGFALGSALIIEFGFIALLYTAIPAWADALFWALGVLGIIACLTLLFYFKNSLCLAEGIVLSEDYTDEKKAILFAAQHKAAKVVAILSLPFFAATVIFLLVFIIVNPQNYWVLNVELAVREAYLGVILANFMVGLLVFTGYLCIAKSADKKFADDRQREVIKRNGKLLKKVCAFGTIPFGALTIVLLSLIIAFPEGYKEVYRAEDYHVFRTHMQTLVAGDGEYSKIPAGEYYLPLPETPEENTEYYLGNGFYAYYWEETNYENNYWAVKYGTTYPMPVWDFNVYFVDTPEGKIPIANVRYHVNSGSTDRFRLTQGDNAYVFEEDIADTLHEAMIAMSFATAVSTFTVCIIIYGIKRKKQNYSF